MGAGHSHGGSAGTAAGRHKSRLLAAFGLTSAFMLAEVVGGLWTGSLALLADAAHMLTDAGGLALALVAIRFAEKPATPQRTYGYVRMEILSALANAVVLLLLTLYILYEAYERFLNPPPILGGPMLAVAVVGLIVNLISMKLLAGGSSESLNVKGAYFEVLSDMLGSLGVIVAAVIVMTTGWTLAEVDIALLEKSLLALPGVTAVHDLHVWTLTSGLDAMSAHIVVADMAEARATLVAADRLLAEEFGLKHTTIQIEDEAIRRTDGHEQRL